MKYTVISPISYKKKRYEIGQVVDMPEEKAKYIPHAVKIILDKDTEEIPAEIIEDATVEEIESLVTEEVIEEVSGTKKKKNV